MRKPGCIEPVEFYVDARGHHILAAYTGCPPPEGYRVEYVDTLAGVDRLQAVLQSQDMQAAEAEFVDEEERSRVVRERVRSNLVTRMRSSDCTPWEREFIEEYLKLRDERKRKKYQDAFLCHTGYLWARENG